MSHKRFLGWEPTRTITTEGDGVQTVTVEPEWDEQERGYMTALAAYEDTLCPVCGGPPEECQTVEAEREWKGVPPTRCHKVTAIYRYQDAEGDKLPHPRALTWNAEKQS